MKSIMSVAAFISLAAVALAPVSVHAQLRQNDVHPTKEVVQPKLLSRNELLSEDHTADALAVEQVWTAYGYYNDTHDGPGMASLFTDDAIVHFVSVDLGKRWDVNNGQGNSSCRLTGPQQIATYYGYNRTTDLDPEYHDGLPFPGAYHHIMTNLLVKVSDDGKTAMVTSTLIELSSSSPGHSRNDPDFHVARIVNTGTYRNFFRKTPEGWKIAEVYMGADKHPLGPLGSAFEGLGPDSDSRSATCDMNGPIPRPNQAESHVNVQNDVHPANDVHPTKEIVQPQRLSRNELFSEDHTADVLAIEQLLTAYSYYNDSHGGPGMGSLFTDDGAIHVLLQNDLGKRIIGSTCGATGHQQIAEYYGYRRTAALEPEYRDGLPFPMGYNHNMTNLLVKVSDDGKTAMSTAILIEMSVSSPGSTPKGQIPRGRDDLDGYVGRITNTGVYRDYYRKTPEGWRIAEKNLVNEQHPLGVIGSAFTGPLPNSNSARLVPCGMNYTITPPNQAAAPQVSVEEAKLRQNDAHPENGVHPTKEVVQPTQLSSYGLFSQDHTADVLAIEQIWTAYSYYNDSHGGPGMGSLFTDDGVVQFLSNDIGKQFLLNTGQGNSSCRLTGPKQIAEYYGYSRTRPLDPEYHDGLPFPMGYNHNMTNLLVKVSDDGKTAMLTATLVEMSISSPGHIRDDPDGHVGRIVNTATYRNYFRKTPEGWRIAEADVVNDEHPLGLIGSAPPAQLPNSSTRNAGCNMNGPIARPN